MTEPDDDGLPRAVAAAWGVRDRPHKGPKPGLSVERIVAAGIAVAGADGLAALSMSRIAAELGAAPMSLYRYVAAKDELLALMVDAAWGDPPTGPPTGWQPPPPVAFPASQDPSRQIPASRAETTPDSPEPAPPGTAPPAHPVWRLGLARWAWALRAGYQQHPWVLGIPISGLPSLPNEVAWFEEGLRCLAGTSLAENEKASSMLLVSGYVRNAASVDADVWAAMKASGKTPDQWMASYARALTMLASPSRFPALARFIAAGVFERADPPDAEFSFGLDRILDGIAALILDRTAGDPAP